MRSSKDLAKRLRFDLLPRRDFFRRRYLLVGTSATVLGLATWLVFTGFWRERQYLPGPVSQNHATFGDRCEACHTPFQSVRNEACLECHPARVHSTFERATPNCRDCHVEHRDVQVFLSVSEQSCVACHGALETTRPEPLIQPVIATFAAHPPFGPVREGRQDTAAVRFNHEIHLTSDKVNEKLVCATCHVMAADGRLMQPIVFETHCRRCHQQEVQGPVGSIEALHESPDVIRPDLVAKLVVMGVENAEEIFQGQNVQLPGRVPRGPIDSSRSLAEYRDRWLEKAESALYAPFKDAPPLLDSNKYCFLCHVQQGDRAPGAFPEIKATRIPGRWLERGEFSHRTHDVLACAACHPDVEKSARTTDVNLPRNQTCLQCHVDDSARSAGTRCMLCHLYHDTSKSPAVRAEKRKEIAIETLKGG